MTGSSRVRRLHLSAGEILSEPLLCEAAGEHSLHVTLSEGARLDVTAFVFASCDTVALSVIVDMEGTGAEFNLNGLWIATGRCRAAIEVRVNHLVPNCISRQLVKGIAADEATGEFAGLIHVAPGAVGTDAVQNSRNLQLDEGAHIFTRPQLEIYADDVRCAHGASIGRLDEEAIYYMRQRGVGEAEARQMQLQGFAHDIIGRTPPGPVREAAAARADLLISGLGA